MLNINLFKGVLMASTLLLSIVVSNTQASEGKGLDSESCNAKASCGWVESYARKDGRQVNAFCRTSTKNRVNVDSTQDSGNNVKP